MEACSPVGRMSRRRNPTPPALYFRFIFAYGFIPILRQPSSTRCVYNVTIMYAMAITQEGALKIAAQKVGMSEQEYLSRLSQGEKWCTGCKEWHLQDAFAVDRSRGDGLTASCRTYRNSKSRQEYQPKPRPMKGRSFVPARDGDRLQARRRINYFVEAGLLPHPNDLPCAYCGDVWEANKPRHEYHHHKGYAAEHHEDIVVVCTACHRREEHGKNRDTME